MKLLERITRLFAATELPTQPPPKPPKPGGVSLLGWRRTVTPDKNQVAKQPFQVANVDLASAYRFGADTQTVIRDFARVSPEMSAAVFANIRVGIPEKYIAIARGPDGEFNEDATRFCLNYLRYLDGTPDYVNGFTQVSTLRSTAESLAKQGQIQGAMAMELVLEKTRTPGPFRALPVEQIFWFGDGQGTKPVQRVGGQDLDLDVPTFFYTSLDQTLTDAYAQSPLEAAVQPVIASTSHLNDMRRLCQRTAYPRYDIVLDSEKLSALMPAEVAADPDPNVKAAWMNARLDEAEQAISNLGPEQAIAHLDYFTIEYVQGQTGDMPETFDTVNNIYNTKVATGAKTPPSVIGLGATNQSISSSETLMFMINANGMVRIKLQEIFSKALTLAARLMGHDVVVSFEYDDIELRPAGELEAYKAQKQSRILTQLSFGMITDAEACLRLTGNLPPAGYAPLAGTRFSVTPAPEADNGQSTSTTSNLSQNSNKAPSATRGSVKGAKK